VPRPIPADVEAVWWLEGSNAGRVIRWATTNVVDVPAAARALNVRPSTALVERANAAVERLREDEGQASGYISEHRHRSYGLRSVVDTPWLS
jgi:hypothetical protein